MDVCLRYFEFYYDHPNGSIHIFFSSKVIQNSISDKNKQRSNLKPYQVIYFGPSKKLKDMKKHVKFFKMYISYAGFKLNYINTLKGTDTIPKNLNGKWVEQYFI